MNRQDIMDNLDILIARIQTLQHQLADSTVLEYDTKAVSLVLHEFISDMNDESMFSPVIYSTAYKVVGGEFVSISDDDMDLN